MGVGGELEPMPPPTKTQSVASRNTVQQPISKPFLTTFFNLLNLVHELNCGEKSMNERADSGYDMLHDFNIELFRHLNVIKDAQGVHFSDQQLYLKMLLILHNSLKFCHHAEHLNLFSFKRENEFIMENSPHLNKITHISAREN